METPDFANLSYLELLALFISLPGMLFWAKIVSDGVRNMVEGNRKLTPWGQKLGAKLRQLSPFGMQTVIVALILSWPLICYSMLAAWVDTSMLSVPALYNFLKWMFVAQCAAAAYYQWIKTRGEQSPANEMPEPGALSINGTTLDLDLLADRVAGKLSDAMAEKLLPVLLDRFVIAPK